MVSSRLNLKCAIEDLGKLRRGDGKSYMYVGMWRVKGLHPILRNIFL